MQGFRAESRVHGQIGPGQITDQQRIAAQQQPGVGGAREVTDHKRQVLWTVAGSSQGADAQRPDRDFVSRAEIVWVGIVATRGAMRAGSGRSCQADPPGHVVGMIVRVDHVGDAQALLASDLEIRLDIPPWIDDGGLSTVSDQI